LSTQQALAVPVARLPSTTFLSNFLSTYDEREGKALAASEDDGLCRRPPK